MTAPLRIGSVPYLNARPLVEGLSCWPGVRYSEDVPARLAADLAAGRLDVALVSSVEALRTGLDRAIPGLCIASEGPVWSVVVASEGDPRSAAQVALDGASLTAAALTRLTYERFFCRPDVRYVAAPAAPDPAASGGDATLVIGDAALRLDPARWRTLDLGATWTAATGLPFVWALWLCREGLPPEAVEPTLRRAATRGRVDPARHAAGGARGIAAATGREYLERIMRYDFGPREDAAVRHFGSLLGLARKP